MNRLNVNFQEAEEKFASFMKKHAIIKSVFYRRIFGGKALDFDSYRKYIPFIDDANLIDWKATMRNAGKPLIRQYVKERDLKIFLLVDVGDNMIFGSEKKLKNELTAEVAAAIAKLILTYGDSFGFALYSDKIKKMRMPSNGIKQLHLFENFLSDASVYGGKSDLGRALSFLMPTLKGISAVFILSDFLNVGENCAARLEGFMTAYETTGIMVRDKVELRLPDLNKEIIVEDIYTGEQKVIDPSLAGLEYEKYSLEQIKRIEDIFKKTGSDLSKLYTEEDVILSLAKFLKSRIRKVRK